MHIAQLSWLNEEHSYLFFRCPTNECMDDKFWSVITSKFCWHSAKCVSLVQPPYNSLGWRGDAYINRQGLAVNVTDAIKCTNFIATFKKISHEVHRPYLVNIRWNGEGCKHTLLNRAIGPYYRVRPNFNAV